MPDMDGREWMMMVPLAAATLWMGIYPESFLAPMRGDIEWLDQRLEGVAPAGDAHLAMPSPEQQAAAAAAAEEHHDAGEGAH